jgi:LacI family transcriptional regulator
MTRHRAAVKASRAAPTIRDIAAYTGFAPMTVSRVINGSQSVRKEASDIINAAIAKLGYSPNLAARALAVGKQMRIGLLFNDASNTFSGEILTSCLEYARQSHVQIVVGKCDLGRHEIEVIQELLAEGVDGVIVPPPLCDSKAVHSLFAKAGALAVAIGSTRPRTSLMTVRIDDFSAAVAMTRHLLSLQHRRIGFIIGDPAQGCSAQRLAGFRAAMTEAQIDVADCLIRQGDFTYRSGLMATDELLKLAHPPTAIFASNDNMAAATVSVAHRYHMEVPKDLTVCGFDDTEMSRGIWPELTTIRQPIADMARTALQMLISAIKAPQLRRTRASKHQVLGFSLVRRESDAAPS